MRIGIFGGTFDPIHLGHIALGRHFLKCLELDQVWFLITPMNPWKKDKILSQDEDRYRLVKIALEEEPGLVASDYEFHLEKPSYSYKTLRHLREDHPKDEVILLIGADNWVKFHEWSHYEEILEHHTIAVYPREGYPVEEATLPKNVILLPPQFYSVSSTQVRNLLAQGKDVSHLVPASICNLL